MPDWLVVLVLWHPITNQAVSQKMVVPTTILESTSVSTLVGLNLTDPVHRVLTMRLSLVSILVLNPLFRIFTAYVPGIYWFYWLSDTLRGPKFDESSRTLLLNLSSNASAGPLILDQTKDRLFFVDMNPYNSYIGIAPLRTTDAGNFTTWLSVSYQIFGFAFDAHYKRRNLYWTVPAVYGADDGKIYYANVDSSPVVYTLSGTVGQVRGLL